MKAMKTRSNSQLSVNTPSTSQSRQGLTDEASECEVSAECPVFLHHPGSDNADLRISEGLLARLQFPQPHHPYRLRSLSRAVQVQTQNTRAEAQDAVTTSEATTSTADMISDIQLEQLEQPPISINFKPRAKQLRIRFNNGGNGDDVYEGRGHAPSTHPNTRLTLAYFNADGLHLVPLAGSFEMRRRVQVTTALGARAPRRGNRRAGTFPADASKLFSVDGGRVTSSVSDGLSYLGRARRANEREEWKQLELTVNSLNADHGE